MGQKKIKITMIMNDYIARSFFMGDTILHFIRLRKDVPLKHWALSLLPNTTIWKKRKERDILGERQEATRMPSTLGGFFWMRSAMVHLPSGLWVRSVSNFGSVAMELESNSLNSLRFLYSYMKNWKFCTYFIR